MRSTESGRTSPMTNSSAGASLGRTFQLGRLFLFSTCEPHSGCSIRSSRSSSLTTGTAAPTYQHPREVGVPESILKEGLPRDVLPSVEKACHERVLFKLVPVLKDLLRHDIPNLKVSAWLLTRDQDDPLDVEPA